MGFGLGQIGGLGRLGRPRLNRGGKSLASLLFGNGEDGFLFGNFAELDELLTVSLGPTNVAANDDPVGLAFDDHSWGGQTLAQVLAMQTNLTPAGAWTMSTAGGSSTATESPSGTLNLFSDGTNGARGDKQITTVAGRTYRIDLTIATNAVSLFAGTTQGAQGLLAVSPNPGTWSYYFVATGTTTWIRLVRNAGGATVVSGISTRPVPGNHALQATAANRPLWKANAGKPYLLFDGANDSVTPPFYPMATGTGLTMAAAFNANVAAAANCVIGGGTPTGDKRAFFGLSGVGALAVGWGTEIAETVPVDRRGANHVVVVTGDVSGRDVWLDNVNVTSLFSAVSGAPDGTGGALTLGGRQNTVGGGPDRLFTGNIAAAVAINRRVTPAEIARIAADFQRTF